LCAFFGCKLNCVVIFTPPRSGIGILQSVCLCVCLSASISLEPLYQSSQNFYADPLWPWLGPPLAALRYIIYFWFYGWRQIWP